MKFVRNLENLFEKYIEGYFNKKFHSELQPVEIAKSLAKELENNRRVSVSRIYVPNSYTIEFNTADYERMSQFLQVFCADWADYLVKEAAERNYLILGKVSIKVEVAADIAEGKYKISSFFSQPIPAEKSLGPKPGADGLSDTQVFNRIDAAAPTKKSGLNGLITIIEGSDLSKKVSFFANRVNIGRRENNELPLTDLNTSRLHAYIVYEENSHFIYDAQSLNGTYVNGRRVTRNRLEDKDRIKVGNTILLYEVV